MWRGGLAVGIIRSAWENNREQVERGVGIRSDRGEE